MAPDDLPGRKRRNPWGNGSNDDRPSGMWGGGESGGGGRNEPPDLDDLLRKTRNNLNNILPGMGGGVLIVIAFMILLTLWLGSGFYIITPGEYGVIQRFGAWSRTQTQEGLSYHLPFPIEQVTKVNVNTQRRLNIGFAESLTRGERGPKHDIPEESMMLTSDRNIVDLNMVIQWDIKSAEDFLFSIENPENTIKKVAESAIREVAGQTDMFTLITTGRPSVEDRTKQIIQKNLDEYDSGVNIKQIVIQKAEVHPDVQSAFQDVQSAKQDAEDTQNQAKAYREDILPKARGQAIQLAQEAQAYKQSQIAKARGDAERFKSVYAAYQSGKDVTKERIYIETMEQVLGNASKIILDEKGAKNIVPYLPLNETTPPAPKSGTASGGQ